MFESEINDISETILIRCVNSGFNCDNENEAIKLLNSAIDKIDRYATYNDDFNLLNETIKFLFLNC